MCCMYRCKMHIDAARIPLKIQVNLHPRHLPTHFPSAPQEPPISLKTTTTRHSHSTVARVRRNHAGLMRMLMMLGGREGDVRNPEEGKSFLLTATSWYRRRKQRSKEAMLIATHSLQLTQEPFPGIPFSKSPHILPMFQSS